MPIRVVTAAKAAESVRADQNKDIMRTLGFEDDLRAASEFYNISPNIEDYVLQSVPVIWSELPNRNGQAFPLRELLAWNKVQGRRAYRGWIGQAVRLEHDWDGPAIGLIADAMLKQLAGYASNKLYKVLLLHAVDRTKVPELANAIEQGQRNSWSIGCEVEGFTCSECGHLFDVEKAPRCSHLSFNVNMRTTAEGRIAFKQARNITAEESSSVGNPAYGIALGNEVIVTRG